MGIKLQRHLKASLPFAISLNPQSLDTVELSE